ncbi:diaminopimelate epimerase [Parasulfitobacter algicola]|uniref:Diaminopimelate epimerase n=1 Tax=Parasulfitobacter algicola TaxID=2614809 RepID=A0ABX2IP42_9RHOB|nr:diaminopimelate epimerase [Sulfitobacter algicola]NSX54125.1 diaminopimelate epimerase [Sulfitobacter algicola]
MKDNSTQNGLAFMKMHGLGNDFVVIDARENAVDVSAGLARALADRHCGVGFDQLAVIQTSDQADVALTFFNADGSHSAACGNATRCIARYEMNRSAKAEMRLKTEHGVLLAQDAGNGLTRVNMGHPQLDWQDIPLLEQMDTLKLPIEGDPVATGMGNPHCTFFVDDIDAVKLETFGPHHEYHSLYPQRTNVQIAQIIGADHLRMRVWERGTGITLASGSSSCAVAVAAARRGLTGRRVTIDLDGGRIDVEWRDDGVWMTGPTMHVFNGRLSAEFLATLQ